MTSPKRTVLGVDFGTTRIVVSAADRGNYPLVSFDAPDGQARDWFPPLVAARNAHASAERRYGWDTLPILADPEWTVARSIKRLLRDAGPATILTLGDHSVPVQLLLTELLAALRDALYTRSSLHVDPDSPLEAMIGVPANANSNQRFLTADAFRAAGFEVIGLLNEPSAASIEFGHRDRTFRPAHGRASLLVYDLGGGTFDASLVEMADDLHEVVATAGQPNLGGDDFDEILATLALEAARHQDLSSAEAFRLYEECREKKESVNPNTRKLTLDLDRVRAGWGDISIPVATFYDRCRPLIEQSREIVEELLAAHPDHEIDTLYVTGGGAELPPVARILRETFGRRVRRSAYMRSATAIGLAISGDVHSGFRLRDRLTQNFGVWREADQGREVAFDLLLPGGTELPGPGEPPFRIVRRYQPEHNIGHFRYVECSRLNAHGQPSGDITVWDDILFPFDPALKAAADLPAIPITRNHENSGNWIEEEYACDAGGNIRVTISNRTAGYRWEYRLGNWSDHAPKMRSVKRGRSPEGHKHR